MFSVPGADAFALILLPMWSLVVNSWAFAVPFCRELPEGWGDTQTLGTGAAVPKAGSPPTGRGLPWGLHPQSLGGLMGPLSPTPAAREPGGYSYPLVGEHC